MSVNTPNKIITHTAVSAKHHTAVDVSQWHYNRWQGYRPSRRGGDTQYAGYHVIIEWDGTVVQCRDYDEEGIHCFTKGHEILTKSGWKDVSIISKKDEIFQFGNQLDNATYAPPKQVIKSRTHEVIESNNQKLKFVATPQHEFLYKKPSDNTWQKTTLESLSHYHNAVIPTSVEYSGSQKYDLPFLKIAIAIVCDGSYIKAENGRLKGAQFAFTKKRKIEKLESLLQELGWKYSKFERGDDQVGIRFFNAKEIKAIDAAFPNKELNYQLVQLPAEIKKSLLDEYVSWDGSTYEQYSYKAVSSSSQKNIDVLQAMAATCGEKRMLFNPKRYFGSFGLTKKGCINASIVDTNKVQTQPRNYRKQKKERDVFCVETELGNILVRYKGTVFATGNCKGQNFSSIGVCFMGNGDVHMPSEEQEAAWVEWYAEHGKNLPIYPHRKYANKNCHGKLLSDDYFAQMVKRQQLVSLKEKLAQLLTRFLVLLTQERMK